MNLLDVGIDIKSYNINPEHFQEMVHPMTRQLMIDYVYPSILGQREFIISNKKTSLHFSLGNYQGEYFLSQSSCNLASQRMKCNKVKGEMESLQSSFCTERAQSQKAIFNTELKLAIPCPLRH
jgi:hypothetical protein